MNLIKYTQDELIFKTAPSLIQKINRLGLIILSVCLISFPFLLYNTGIKKLKCDRLNVTQINYNISEKKLLALLKVQDINTQNIS
jgi:hypothetical protein